MCWHSWDDAPLLWSNRNQGGAEAGAVAVSVKGEIGLDMLRGVRVVK